MGSAQVSPSIAGENENINLANIKIKIDIANPTISIIQKPFILNINYLSFSRNKKY